MLEKGPLIKYFRPRSHGIKKLNIKKKKNQKHLSVWILSEDNEKCPKIITKESHGQKFVLHGCHFGGITKTRFLKVDLKEGIGSCWCQVGAVASV